VILGLVGELGKFGSPLEDLSEMVGGRDGTVELVDEDVAEAIGHSIESGITWGTIAEALRAA
jgi:hypothetical protein